MGRFCIQILWAFHTFDATSHITIGRFSHLSITLKHLFGFCFGHAQIHRKQYPNWMYPPTISIPNNVLYHLLHFHSSFPIEISLGQLSISIVVTIIQKLNDYNFTRHNVVIMFILPYLACPEMNRTLAAIHLTHSFSPNLSEVLLN